MNKTRKSKIVFYELLSVFFIFCLSFSVQAEDHSTETQVLIAKIKTELHEYKEIQKNILLKFPDIGGYRLQVRNFGSFADYFRVTNDYNNYIRSLTKPQQENFIKYLALLIKVNNTKSFLYNNRFNEIMKLITKYESHNNNFQEIKVFSQVANVIKAIRF